MGGHPESGCKHCSYVTEVHVSISDCWPFEANHNVDLFHWLDASFGKVSR